MSCEMYVRLKSEPVPQHIRDLLIRLDLEPALTKDD